MSRRTPLLLCVVAALFFFGTLVVAFAQQDAGIIGVVTDESGAVLTQDGFDILVGVVELEDAFGLEGAFAADNGAEQLVFVGEVDVKRALGDAGGARDLVHAGAVKAQIHEYLAGAIEDLPPL